MSKKAKLSQLHKELTDAQEKDTLSQPTVKKTVASAGANPARGDRGDFLKITITMPPEMVADLKRLGLERRLQGDKDTDVSSLVRAAVETHYNL